MLAVARIPISAKTPIQCSGERATSAISRFAHAVIGEKKARARLTKQLVEQMSRWAVAYPGGDGVGTASGRSRVATCANWSDRYAQFGRICQTHDRWLLSFFAGFQESIDPGTADELASRARAASIGAAGSLINSPFATLVASPAGASQPAADLRGQGSR